MRLKFEFQYDTKGDDKTMHPFGCTCQILTEEGFVLGTGSSLCHPDDQFVKKLGKKIALQRAIHDAGDLTYEERAALWSKLFPV